jgi:hypothetical protein
MARVSLTLTGNISYVIVYPSKEDDPFPNFKILETSSVYVNNFECIPYRGYVNDNPMYIQPNEDGYFAVTINADRRDADQLAIYIPDEEGCSAGELISVTDLMLFEGDYIDCHPTAYMDPSETRYIAEYRTTNDPYGFGKHRLI